MLVIASLWTWAIIFEKLRTIGREFRYADDFEDEFWSGGALDQLYDTLGPEPDGIMARVFSAAMREWRRATARGNAGGNGAQYLGQRIDRTMSVTIARELAFIEKGMTFLASVGSVAPFVGLFGTVWGIMNSFQSIAQSKNTSLAVVARGLPKPFLRQRLVLLLPSLLWWHITAFPARLKRWLHALKPSAANSAPFSAVNLTKGRLSWV